MTREQPSPSGFAVGRSRELVDVEYQDRLVLTDVDRQVGGVQVRV